ncbi:MAG: nucleotidyltransferase family protein [Rhodocyclaceae bacterium]|nr:nucleotidyltransferase family protein [Rhodocyclaceae bacterium]MDP2195350.1 nucleotidyltransferase family protein [Rhodocyclaceae bacterium]
MRPSEACQQHKETIHQIVGRNRATNPRVFGSVLHGEDTEGSDLDLLVDAAERTTLFDIVMIERQLHEALGVKVDVHTPESLSKRFRSVVLSEAASL